MGTELIWGDPSLPSQRGRRKCWLYSFIPPPGVSRSNLHISRLTLCLFGEKMQIKSAMGVGLSPDP